jgi:hypothetical protein
MAGGIRLLVEVEEFTRECLTVGVARHLSNDGVLECLWWLCVPEFIRTE